MSIVSGKILKSVGGFYTVEAPCGVLNCKARGVFRVKNISPMAGDIARVQLDDNAEPLIVDIADRKNSIIRPPLANLDAALLVVSTCEPAPNAFVLDKLIAIFESKDIEPVLVFTKKDKLVCSEFISIYEKIGFTVFAVDNTSGDGAEQVISYIKGKTTALIGNSGVGKSSLMNLIKPDLKADTNEISKKLGRGRHTTRQAELYKLDENTYIADTPGFSTVEIGKYGAIPSTELMGCFREFAEFNGKCRFNNCVHMKEAGCLVTEAVKNGIISESRYGSYTRMYEEAKIAENTY